MRIIIGNKVKLLEPPDKIVNWLINQLTFPNPKFEEARKHNRYTGDMPQLLELYEMIPNGIIIPRGMLETMEKAFLGKGYNVSVVDNRVINKPLKNIESNILLRPYQNTAKFDLLKHPNGMLIAPAASGKTILGLDIFTALRQKMIWMTHTTRLANQVRERILGNEEDPPMLPTINVNDIGLIGRGKWKIGNKITIGIIQTLVRRLPFFPELGKEFGLVIVDECLVAGSQILMLNGNLKDIKEIENGNTTIFGKVSNKFCRLTDRTIQLRGNWGILEGTPTHQLPYIPRKNLRTKHNKISYFYSLREKDVMVDTIDNIQPRDFLLVSESFCHTEKYKIGKEKSRLLALIACDGHIEKHLYCIQIGITKDKDWFLEEMLSDTSYVDNPDVRTSNCTRGDLIIRSYSKQIIKDMNEFIPAGKKSKVIEVPSILMEAHIEDIKNFLQVVFDTEGAVTDQITLTMSSHKFIYGIHFLLRKLGIVSRLIPIRRKNYLGLSMAGYDAFLFWNKIGFSIPRKQKKLTELMKETGKFRRTVKYKGIEYRCMPILDKNVINKRTKVYDFTTESHLFLANGILSSNCHHVPASTFLKVLEYFYSYYLYGLTATPYRRDGLESVMFASMGRPNAIITREKVKKRGNIITPIVKVREISSTIWEDNDYHYIIREIILPNEVRSNLITLDVASEASKGNCCIVISTRKEYCEILFKKILKYWPKTGIATGDYTRNQNDEQVRKLESDEITVLITTFELLGEGFDVQKLNRGFIALPFRERARVEQAVGRIQRTCQDKIDAILYDYVDKDIGILKDQFRARSFVYKSLGMKMIR